jgi:hypothetical protein
VLAERMEGEVLEKEVEVLKMDDGGMGLEKRILVGILKGRRGMGVGKEDKGRMMEERMEGG